MAIICKSAESSNQKHTLVLVKKQIEAKERKKKNNQVEDKTKISHSKRLADLNEELRQLFEEERKVMAEEQERIESEIEQNNS